MMDLFFNVLSYSYSFLLIQALAILVIFMFTLWIVNILVVKALPAKLWPKYSHEIMMKYTLLISLSIVSIFYSIYIFSLLKIKGYSFLVWSASKTYIIISPHIFLYLVMFMLFVSAYTKFKSLTSGKR